MYLYTILASTIFLFTKTSSGLGLSIAKELVLRMDGKISAQIEENEFCVEIVFPE